MSELLPCPFCGGETDEYEGDYGNGIYCMQCGAMVGEPIHLGFNVAERVSYEQAVEAWNTRAERTCENISEPPTGFYCSSCHWGDFCEPSHLLTTAKFTGRDDGGPNYCPNCGRKVEP